MIKKMITVFYPDDPEDRNSFKETLPFFLFAITVLGWLYFDTLGRSFTLKDPIRSIPFTILYIIHLALYWTIFQFVKRKRGSFFYVLIQGSLSFLLVWLSNSFPLAIGLYCALIGNVVGMFGRSRQAVYGIVFYLFLLSLNFLILNEFSLFQKWLNFFLPAGSFAAFFSYFLRKQMDGREKDRAMLKKLEIAHAQLADYSNKLENLTLTNERQRMARELHDTLAQGLAGLILQLEAADHYIEEGNTNKSKQIVQQAMKQARATLVDARKAIDDLRVELSDPAAFTEAIIQEVERFKDATGIPCDLSMNLPDYFDEDLAEQLFRAISESLTNIARHAQASSAKVSLAEIDGHIEVLVRDNGMGFDYDKEFGRPGHYGLLGIRERGRLAGGRLEINSQLGEGTEVKISIPVGEKINV